jgi:hypothetical protein
VIGAGQELIARDMRHVPWPADKDTITVAGYSRAAVRAALALIRAPTPPTDGAA